jgi:polyhydroxybutyrate depolymerase
MLPVVLAFHGGGQRPEGLADIAAIQNASAATNFIIVYPEGYKRFWNEGGVCCDAAMEARIDDVSFVRAILNDLDTVIRIDRRRVYATGYSNGGGLSYYLACVMSDRVAAIAPVSSAMREPKSRCNPTRPIPVFEWHGLLDKVSPYNGGPTVAKETPPPPVREAIEFWQQTDGTRRMEHTTEFGGAVQCDFYLDGREGSRVQQCRVPSMGHRWPGSQPTPRSSRVDQFMSRFFFDLGPYGPPFDANDMILRFFSDYALPFEPPR